MQEKLTKVDNKTAELVVVRTTTEKQVFNIDTLVYERDSLIRTKNTRLDEQAQEIARIDAQIKSFNLRIKTLTDLGLVAGVVAPEVPVEETNTTEKVVVEPTEVKADGEIVQPAE